MVNIHYNKYKNRKVQIDRYVFDSVKEGKRYRELALLEQAGEISDLELQPKFLLQESFRKNGKTYRSISYIADFMYKQNGKTIVEDVKGIKTDVFKLKLKLFEYKYPELEIKIIWKDVVIVVNIPSATRSLIQVMYAKNGFQKNVKIA